MNDLGMPMHSNNVPKTAGGRQRIFQASERRVVENADGSSDTFMKQMQYQQTFQGSGDGNFISYSPKEQSDAHSYECSVAMSFQMQRMSIDSNGNKSMSKESFNTQDSSNQIGSKLASPRNMQKKDDRLKIANSFFKYDGNALSQLSGKMDLLLK